MRGDIVLLDAKAVGVLEPEPLLSAGVALIGRLAIPTRRSRLVLRDAQAVGVLEPEPVLKSLSKRPLLNNTTRESSINLSLGRKSLAVW